MREKVMNRAVRVYYQFGPFRLDVSARVLLREGEIVPLTPKIFETLLLLLQHRGKLVEREQLIQTVWHDDYIEEGNISSTIYLLRKVLGDKCYIATVPRHGYRFIAPVRELRVAEQTSPVQTASVIAILPFRSLNTQERDDGLSLGLADALITQLSHSRKLTVRPTSVIRKYVNSEIDHITAGQELGVELIVECNYQRLGEHIRVTAQLISVTDDVPMWASTYDEHFDDLFTIEDTISRNISNDLIFELVEKPILTISDGQRWQ
jgi:DNA-binding winged helix-turn-helix (wHTH) protein